MATKASRWVDECLGLQCAVCGDPIQLSTAMNLAAKSEVWGLLMRGSNLRSITGNTEEIGDFEYRLNERERATKAVGYWIDTE